MKTYIKKPIAIQAAQWFKNGDHPEDYTSDEYCHLTRKTITAEFRKQGNWEGEIVRYYRHPNDSGERQCEHCGNVMHAHGWIDTLEGGHVVCPGDWIITGIKGEKYPCKPDIFEASYSEAAPAVEAVPLGYALANLDGTIRNHGDGELMVYRNPFSRSDKTDCIPLYMHPPSLDDNTRKMVLELCESLSSGEILSLDDANTFLRSMYVKAKNIREKLGAGDE